MSNNPVRTVVVFGIIALVLGGAIIGGIRLMKTRNISYASGQSHQTASTDTSRQQAATQQPKQEAKKDAAKSNTSTSDQTKTNQGQQKATDNKSAASTTPTPNQSSVTQTTTPPPVTNPQSSGTSNALPATSGMTPADFFATVILMATATFFGSKLLKARADYRRYLNLQ